MMGIERRPGGVFYGWRIVAAGAAVQTLISGLLLQAYGAYVTQLREEFPWSGAALAAGFSLLRAESGLLGPFQGWLLDRFGPRRVMRAGLCILGLGFVLFSQIETLAGFFVAFSLLAVGAALAGVLTVTTTVVNWFERRRAVALALASTGLALGGLLVPLVVVGFGAVGWRGTALASGVLVVVLMPLTTRAIHHRPEDVGLSVDGVPSAATRGPAPPGARRDARPGNEGDTDHSAREALATLSFWLISFGHASAVVTVSAVLAHLVPHVTGGLGFSLRAASLAVVMMTSMQLLGMVGGGVLGDRGEKRLIAAGCMVLHGLALVLVTYAQDFWVVAAGAMLHGFAWGARGPLMQAIRADYFGRTSFGKIMGLSSLVVLVGSTAGPILAGSLHDLHGDYRAAFTAIAGVAFAGSLFFVFSKPPATSRRAGSSRRR